MGISTFLQTAHRVELCELQTCTFDCSNFRDVVEHGLQRARALESAPAADGLPVAHVMDAEHFATESLAAPILRHSYNSVEPESGCVSTRLVAPDAPSNTSVLLKVVPDYGPDGPPPCVPFKARMQRDPPTIQGWRVEASVLVEESEDECTETEFAPPRGLIATCEHAWAEMRAWESELLLAGYAPFIHEEDAEMFKWTSGEDKPVTYRPHHGACVLDLDKTAEAVAHTTSLALAAAGSRRYAPKETSLLQCLTTSRQNQIFGEVAYGGARLIFEVEVWLLDRELAALTAADFAAAWQPEGAEWPAVLGGLTKERLQAPGELEHALACFKSLQAFVHSAAERGLGIIAHRW